MKEKANTLRPSRSTSAHLVIEEKIQGSDGPDVATILNNLANLYYSQRQYAAAEPLYKRSLAIQEKILGPENPQVATVLNNLAVFYKVQGRFAEAEPLYKGALTIQEKALGPDHPDVAMSLNNLAGLYNTQPCVFLHGLSHLFYRSKASTKVISRPISIND